LSELESGHHQTPHLGSGLGRYIASAPADRGVFKRDAVLEVHTDCNEVFLRLMGSISWIVLYLIAGVTAKFIPPDDKPGGLIVKGTSRLTADYSAFSSACPASGLQT
jgi:hypothetical protein